MVNTAGKVHGYLKLSKHRAIFVFCLMYLIHLNICMKLQYNDTTLTEVQEKIQMTVLECYLFNFHDGLNFLTFVLSTFSLMLNYFARTTDPPRLQVSFIHCLCVCVYKTNRNFFNIR